MAGRTVYFCTYVGKEQSEKIPQASAWVVAAPRTNTHAHKQSLRALRAKRIFVVNKP